MNLLVGDLGTVRPTLSVAGCLRAGVGWVTGWLTVNARAGRQIRTGKTVGSSPFHWLGGLRKGAVSSAVPLRMHGIANDWVTAGFRRRLALRAGLNVQSGHRKWAESEVKVGDVVTQLCVFGLGLRAVLTWDVAH